MHDNGGRGGKQYRKERLRELKNKHRLNLRTIASILGIGEDAVKGWNMQDEKSERSRNITQQDLIRLEQVLNEVPTELEIYGPDGSRRLVAVLEWEEIKSRGLVMYKVFDRKTKAIFPVLKNARGTFTPSVWEGVVELPKDDDDLNKVIWVDQTVMAKVGTNNGEE
jgi:transcriptional regulator with XRE-family HTH domain